MSAWPARTPTGSTTSWWLFSPQTREVQFDEKWSFVAKKEGHLEAGDAPEWGDVWDHTAVDAEHRLLLAVVPGKRILENCQRIVQEVQQQTAGRTDLLLTSDEHAPYATAIEEAYHQLVPVAKRPGPGRPPERQAGHAGWVVLGDGLQEAGEGAGGGSDADVGVRVSVCAGVVVVAVEGEPADQHSVRGA
jgi:hypothetical protein